MSPDPDALPPGGRGLTIVGPAGRIEYALDRPAGPARGWAFVGHPHPLYGGSLDNKVTATLARAFAALGWVSVRPNFRGVGASEGVHDNGEGETADFLFLADAVPRATPWRSLAPPDAPVALAGFSFGAFVAARAARERGAQGRPPAALALVGTPAGKWPVPPVDPDALIIHGELDETIPLADVLAWARNPGVPVVVLPETEHFFHRRLALLKRLVMRALAGAAQLEAGGLRGGPADE